MIETRFKELADKRNLSINKISTDTGISRPTLTTMYKGKTTGIQFENLETLLNYFDVDLADFLYETKEKNTLLIRPYISAIDNIYTAQEKTPPFYNSVVNAAIDQSDSEMEQAIKKVETYYKNRSVNKEEKKVKIVDMVDVDDLTCVYICHFENSTGKSFDFKLGTTPIMTPEKHDILGLQLIFLASKKFGNKIKEFTLKLSEATISNIVKALLLSWYQQKYYPNHLEETKISPLQMIIVSASGNKNLLNFPVNFSFKKSNKSIVNVDIKYLKEHKPELETVKKIDNNFVFHYLKVNGI